MRKLTWFTSDTHFGHTNIIRYSGRPFDTVEEHDVALIANWNDCVQQGDDVFFLGDFAFKNKQAAADIRKRLNGNIHFIEGNHDSAAHGIRQTFIWFKQMHDIDVGEQRITLCHYAMRVWNRSHHGAWHLYGHSHYSLPDDPNALSLDVGVDAVAGRLAGVPSGQFIQRGQTNPRDYRPMHFDELKALMDLKTFVPVDHHTAETVNG